MDVNHNRSLAIFTELLAIPSPPGHEARMADRISRFIEDAGYEYRRDGAGNIEVDVPGRTPSLGRQVFAAHMDEIAMVVEKVDADGSLHMVRSGGLYPAKIGEGPVTLLGTSREVTGILSLGSYHKAGAASQAVTWEDARVLTGFSREDLADFGVRVGTPATIAVERRGPVLLGPEDDPLVAAWTFDDRMGVAALLRVLEELRSRNLRPERPTSFAFTVHEEGGCHGAKNVARRLTPEIFVAVDGCPIPPGTDLVLDGTPGIWCKDRVTVYDPGLVEDFSSAAARAGTRLQRAVFASAGSDASAVYDAGFADRVATIGHVRENSHGFEIARLSSFEALFSTLIEYLVT